MKFINYLESITGIGIYPLASLFIFLGFFLVVTLFVIKADKKYIDNLKNLPFDNK
jgi:cytochrome c oxidase cbb3-type subunit 3